jgi:hypothetical protein
MVAQLGHLVAVCSVATSRVLVPEFVHVPFLLQEQGSVICAQFDFDVGLDVEGF